MPDFSKGFIYKLCCNDVDITEIYVGSSTNFKQRKKCHKGGCNNENLKQYNYYVYQFIRENGGFENWSMIEIIKYPCETKRELETKEREYIELLKASLNKNKPTRTKKEWNEENKDKVLESSRKKYKNNKEKLLEKSKEYYDNNKEKKKAYYEANRDKINEKARLKRQADKLAKNS